MKNFLLLVFTSTRHANIFCNTNLPSIREIYPIRIASSFDGVFNYNLKTAQNGKEIIFNSFGLLRWSVVTREPFSLQRSSVVTVNLGSGIANVCFTNPTSGFKIIFGNTFNSNKFILIK